MAATWAEWIDTIDMFLLHLALMIQSIKKHYFYTLVGKSYKKYIEH